MKFLSLVNFVLLGAAVAIPLADQAPTPGDVAPVPVAVSLKSRNPILASPEKSEERKLIFVI